MSTARKLKVTDEEINKILLMREMKKKLRINDELWAGLVERAKKAYKSWKARELITSDKTTTTKKLKQAFEDCGLRYRSWHCCRHSKGTFLYGKTGDKALSMEWLGHSSERVHSKYFHTYEALMREIKAKDFDLNKN